ncbi:hypothetical protein L1887_17609 [Cichorium endivia]|nr:hypothetical protein L1887_17609 [Cichorium endivia]
MDTGYLTKESDVYSFGVVLFEVLCGRLCIVNYDDNRRFLSKWAQRCYEEKKLKTIVLDCLQEQISPDCLDKFSKIAYQCLAADRNERPQVAEIIKQLKIAFEYQVEYMVEKEKKLRPCMVYLNEKMLKSNREQMSSNFEKDMEPQQSLIQPGDMSE